MRVHTLRFIVAGAFVALGFLLLFREVLAPGLFARFQDSNLALGCGLAFVLGGWHAARGYMDLLNWRARSRPVRHPLQTHDDEHRPYEKNPDFDFIKLPDADENPR